MKYFNKKSVVLVFIALIIVSIAPKPAYAGAVPVILINPNLIISIDATAVNTGITAGATGATITEISFEWAFKIAAEALKRQLLDMIVDQIVQWIQGGGDPKFITDWPGFFRDAVDQAGGRFIQKIGLSQLCSPFKPLLSAAFIPIPTFTERTSCTFSQIGVNIDAFLNDFQSGGWVAWQEMVLKPQNNIYGAYLMAWDQYEIEKSAADKAASAEAQAGKGFLGVRGGCIERNFEGYQSCIESGASAEECDEASCIRRETITPGAAVGDMAGKALGSDIDYIVNAQDFAAYVGAIVNAILNRVFAEGVGLLHAGVSGGSGGGKTPEERCAPFLGTPDYNYCLDALDQCVPLLNTLDYDDCIIAAQCVPFSDTPDYEDCIITQAQCNPLWGKPAYDSCITTVKSGINIREFQKNYLISLIDQDLAYQNQLLGAKQATLIVLNQTIDILNQLNNCQGSVSPALAQVQSAKSAIESQLPQIQSDIIARKGLQDKIKAITDVSQIAPLWAQVASIVNPALTYSLALAAQNETSQKQQELSNYQQQLDFCLR